MSGAFAILGWVIIAGFVFVPVFIVALVMLRAPARALLLSFTFTGGALLGFAACAVLGYQLIRPYTSAESTTYWFVTFATAGAIGGAVLAVHVLGRFSKHPPWRRQ
jgi:hypothetical protein